MRFTKFLAATMAAMTIASCSEQVTDFGQEIQPGDAVLSFKVGTGGGTTYASTADETNVKTLQAFLAYTNGSNQPAILKIDGTSAGITHTLADGTYTAGAAKLYLVANKAITTTPADEAALKALTDNKAIYTLETDTLKINTEGMTATRVVNIELKSGPVNSGTDADGTQVTGAVPLKRLAARVYAESTTPKATDITGYKVDFAGTTNEANLFSYIGSITGSVTAPQQYTLKGVATGQYSTKEAVGYVYPSATDVTIKVTHKDDSNITKEVKFKPESNKNYKLLITPSTSGGATLNFTVVLKAYDNTDLGTADFGSTTLKVKDAPTNLPNNVKVVNGALVVEKSLGDNNIGIGQEFSFANLFDGDYANLQVVEEVSTYAIGADYSISEDSQFAVKKEAAALSVISLTNNGTSDKTYQAKFTGWNGKDDSSKKEYEIVFILKGLPANLTTTVNGIQMLNVGYQADLDATLALIKTIEGESGTTFVDKVKAYADKSSDNKLKVLGIPRGQNQVIGACPTGYRHPTLNEAIRLVGTTDVPAKDGEKNLSTGANMFGTTTLNFQPKQEVMLTDAKGNKLYLPIVEYGNKTGNYVSNILTSDKKGSQYYRLIFWDSVMQIVANTSTDADSYVRCIRDVNSDPKLSK